MLYLYRKGVLSMEKNYYEWLEINENASKEIIEKAYKTLVKKYHPDLQENNKSEYEEIIKKINEAYEILSDETKKSNYDIFIKEKKISNEDFINLKKENLNLKNKINILKSKIIQQNKNLEQKYNTPISNSPYKDNTMSNNQNDYYYEDKQYNEHINNAINKAYYDTYIQDLKNRGYKIKYKKSFKDYMKSLIAIVIVILIWIILWQVPFIRNYLIGIYNDNSLIKSIVDIILKLFN